MKSVNDLEKELSTRIDRISDKLVLLEALERRVALALIDVLPTREARVVDTVPGYDITPIKQGRKTKWIWKHFVRSSRSTATFSTRQECIQAAKRNALEQLAYGKPSADIADILDSIKSDDKDGDFHGTRSAQLARRIQAMDAH